MCHELRDGPVHRREAPQADAHWYVAFRAHAARRQQHFQGDGEAARALILLVEEIWQGPRVALGARKGSRAKGCQRVQAHDPWRYRGREVLGKEGTEGLVLPALDVAGRPIVHEAEPRDVRLRLADRNGLAERIARP